MKRFFTFLTFIVMIITAKAQSADYELLGFADENGTLTSSIVMNSTQDLKPRVILKNNGPSLASLTDSLIFDIFYNESNYVTSMVVMGS